MKTSRSKYAYQPIHTSAVLLTCAMTVAAPMRAQNGHKPRDAALQSVLDATVAVTSATPDGTVRGSGFVVDPSGIVVTAAHVIRGSTSIQLRLSSGRSLSVAGILYQDSATDIAVIKAVGGDLPSLHLSRDTPAVGDRLLAVGSPLGLDFTVSDGLLSAQRLVHGRRLLQISIPVSPGSSGGPVVTENGAVVGLVVSGLRGDGAENLNFALPISYVAELLPIVRAQQPTPVGLVQAAPTYSRGSAPGVGAPAVVNDVVRFNWKSLDGVEGYFEQQVNPQWRVKATTRYAVSVDPRGVPTLERHESDTYEYRRQALFAQWEPVYRDETRTVLGLGPHREVDAFATRVPLQQQAPRGNWETVISDSSLVLTASGTELVRQSVPVGVLPTSLQGAALAALPDSIGDVIYLWEVGVDSTHATVMPVEVRRKGTTQVQVRVPAAGQHCSESARTEARSLQAWQLEISVGAAVSEVLVLSKAPHVVLTGSECLVLPLLNHG